MYPKIIDREENDRIWNNKFVMEEIGDYGKGRKENKKNIYNKQRKI
jgi:hypothetical protein